MIQVEVNKVGPDEHEVRVLVPGEEFERVYAEHLARLQAKARLPGFRPGKTPRQLLEQRFGAQARGDAISELVQGHYIEAIEKSGLTPAVQPELDVPAEQPEEGFAFTLKVTTWPDVKLADLSSLSMDETTVEVTDEDVQTVVNRLLDNQVRYEVEADREARRGDEVVIDFVGFVDNEPFEGGRGEDAHLVLGSGQFIPGFEDQLEGARAGDERTVSVTFPADYRHANLAGKPARFEVVVKSVGAPHKAENEQELAEMLGFEDAEALRADIRQRLQSEATQASFESNRQAAFDALLAANEVRVPEAMIRQDMRETRARLVRTMREQGLEVTPEMLNAPEYEAELRRRAERSLAVSLLLNAVRETHGLTVSDEELNAAIEDRAAQYPEEQREAFKQWLRGQQQEVEALRGELLEKKCVACIIEHARTKPVRISLSEWQRRQEAAGDKANADEKGEEDS